MRILESSFMIMYVYNNVWVVCRCIKRTHANEEKSRLFISDIRPVFVLKMNATFGDLKG